MTHAPPPTARRADSDDIRIQDHACHLYASAEEALAVGARVLATARARGERALWLHAPGAEVEAALAAAGLDVAAELARGTLELLPARQFFLPGGSLEPDVVLNAWRARANDASRRGFGGLLAVADMAWTLEPGLFPERISEYAARLGAALELGVGVLCQFDRARFPEDVLLAAVRAHPLVLQGGQLLRNPEVLPASALLEPEPPGAALERLLARLHEREASEGALRESERLHRLLTENAKDVVFRIRLAPQPAFEYVSPSVLDVLGYTPQELYRDPSLIRETVHPDDRWTMEASISSAHQPEGPREIRWVARDGRVLWTEQQVVFERDATGRAVAVEGIVRDVTARKRDEERLRESEERFRSVVTALAEGIVFFGADGVIQDCNDAAERILALPRAQIVGRRSTEDWGSRREDGSPLQPDGYPANVTLRTGVPVRDQLMGLPQPDGTLRWVTMTSEPLSRPGEPRPYGVVTSFSDVSAERRAWVEVRRREAQLRVAMECAGHAYWEIDPATGAMAGAPWTLVGWAPDEFPPRVDAWVALIHPDDRGRRQEALDAHVEGLAGPRDAYFRVDYRVRDRDDRWHWVTSSGRAIARDAAGRAVRMAGTITEITERRRLEEELRHADRLASAGTLAAGLAHEVNNPLAYVVANLGFIQEALDRLPVEASAVRDELRRSAHDALDGAARVRGIVAGLRQFAMPSRRSAPAPVDVRAELDAAVGIARSEVTARARLLVDVAPDLPRVRAGEHELGQVLVNLLVNAAQAIPESRPADHQVRVSGRAEGGQVILEVSDTGSGIAAELLPRIFDPFFTTKPVGAGSGLGLAVCHGIVRSLGGTLTARSALGAGTTFRVALPAVQEAPSPAAEAASRPAGTGRRGRVLVVDDEPLVGKSLARLLSGAHDVTALSSPLEALRRAEAGERWDVVLCDLMMPELSGMDLEERLREVAPELVERVLYLTGGAFTDRSRAFLAAGRPFLEKPVDPAVLRRQVAERVERGAGA